MTQAQPTEPLVSNNDWKGCENRYYLNIYPTLIDARLSNTAIFIPLHVDNNSALTWHKIDILSSMAVAHVHIHGVYMKIGSVKHGGYPVWGVSLGADRMMFG